MCHVEDTYRPWDKFHLPYHLPDVFVCAAHWCSKLQIWRLSMQLGLHETSWRRKLCFVELVLNLAVWFHILLQLTIQFSWMTYFFNIYKGILFRTKTKDNGWHEKRSSQAPISTRDQTWAKYRSLQYFWVRQKTGSSHNFFVTFGFINIGEVKTSQPTYAQKSVSYSFEIDSLRLTFIYLFEPNGDCEWWRKIRKSECWIPLTLNHVGRKSG